MSSTFKVQYEQLPPTEQSFSWFNPRTSIYITIAICVVALLIAFVHVSESYNYYTVEGYNSPLLVFISDATSSTDQGVVGLVFAFGIALITCGFYVLVGLYATTNQSNDQISYWQNWDRTFPRIFATPFALAIALTVGLIILGVALVVIALAAALGGSK